MAMLTIRYRDVFTPQEGAIEAAVIPRKGESILLSHQLQLLEVVDIL